MVELAYSPSYCYVFAALMQLKAILNRDLVASERSGKAEEKPVPGALPGLFANEHGVRRASGSMKRDMRAVQDTFSRQKVSDHFDHEFALPIGHISLQVPSLWCTLEATTCSYTKLCSLRGGFIWVQHGREPLEPPTFLKAFLELT
jgi:hypothetical protein